MHGLSCIVSDKIDKECNLKINDFFFEGIQDENIESWCERIITIKKKKDVKSSVERIEKLKMDSGSSAKELLKIYIGR